MPEEHRRCQYISSEWAIKLFNLIDDTADGEIRSLIHIFTWRNLTTAYIKHHICEVYMTLMQWVPIHCCSNRISHLIFYEAEIWPPSIQSCCWTERLSIFEFLKSFLGEQRFNTDGEMETAVKAQLSPNVLRWRVTKTRGALRETLQ